MNCGKETLVFVKVSIGPRVSLFAQQTDVLLFAIGQLAAQGAIEELALFCRLELDPQSNKPGPLGCWDRSDLGPYLSCLLLPALRKRRVFKNCANEPLAFTGRSGRRRAGCLEPAGITLSPDPIGPGSTQERVQECLGEEVQRSTLVRRATFVRKNLSAQNRRNKSGVSRLNAWSS